MHQVRKQLKQILNRFENHSKKHLKNHLKNHLEIHSKICSTFFFIQFFPALQNLPAADKLVKDDIDNSLECLQMFEKQYTDVKTYYDILLYQTNNGWRCAIDVALDVSQ